MVNKLCAPNKATLIQLFITHILKHKLDIHFIYMGRVLLTTISMFYLQLYTFEKY